MVRPVVKGNPVTPRPTDRQVCVTKNQELIQSDTENAQLVPIYRESYTEFCIFTV
jgi:hypothetical protein